MKGLYYFEQCRVECLNLIVFQLIVFIYRLQECVLVAETVLRRPQDNWTWDCDLEDA